MTSPFQIVFDRCRTLMPFLDMQPGKTIQAVKLIQEWLDIGCNAEQDIIPTINTLWAKNPAVSTLAYFDKAVRQAMEKRTQSAAHLEREDRLKAEAFAWKRKRGMFLATYEEQFLNDFESEHTTSLESSNVSPTLSSRMPGT
jgi:hypothetical protein